MRYIDTVLCTVGASLLTNLKKSDVPEIKAAFEKLNQGDFKSAAAEMLKIKDPADRVLGAEINSMYSLIQKGYIDSTQKLYLLVSDTQDGDQMGKLLKEYFLSKQCAMQFKNVEIVKAEKLSDKNRHEFRTHGLRNLAREMARVAKDNPNRIMVNATGGYKATIAYAVVLGQALNIPVYYKYENFDEIIELLPLPVSLSAKVYEKHKNVFAYLDCFDTVEEEIFLKQFGYASWAKVEDELKILLDRVEMEGKELISINPLGEIYLESFEWDCSVLDQPFLKTDRDPEDKIAGTGGHGLAILSESRGILEKIAKIPWVGLIQMTGSSEGEKGEGFKIWTQENELKMMIKTRKGEGYLLIKPAVETRSPRLLECMKRKLEEIISE
ncbi:MAG TPA: putative CRISPR-associated protein [Pseudothermotoga sp.]|nr:putative CRISPR-associated protein [Pseudothermotoga sp.]